MSGARLGALVVALVAALAAGACSDGDEAGAPATTAPPSPACAALADLGAAWDIRATGPELGDPEALRAVAAAQEEAIAAATAAALATGQLPDDVATDLELVATAGVAYLAEALAWATGDDPGAQPVLEPGVTEAQRRIDAWAVDACGAEVWP